MKTLALVAHPGHDHFKLDEKSGLWLPLVALGVLVTLVMLVHAFRKAFQVDNVNHEMSDTRATLNQPESEN